MKYILYFFIIVILISCSDVQKEIENKYPDGSKEKVIFYSWEGKDKKILKEVNYWENGNIRYELDIDTITYYPSDKFKSNPLKSGKFTYYYENGVKSCEGYLSQGDIYQKIINYHRNGKIHKIQYPYNGNKYYEYYENGTLKEERDINKSIHNFYYETGEIFIKGFYTNGNEDSMYIYYKDGLIKAKYYFDKRKNNVNIEIIAFHPNQKIMMKGQIKNNIPIGNWYSYYEDGNILEHSICRNDTIADIIWYNRDKSIANQITNIRLDSLNKIKTVSDSIINSLMKIY